MEGRRIGEILVAEGWLSEGAVQRALAFQQSSADRIKLGSILLEWDLLAEETLLESLAKLHRCPPVTWEMLAVADISAVRLLPGTHAIRLNAMPLGVEGGALRVAFANPSNLATLDEVSAITGKRIVPGVTTEVRLMQAHQRFYGRHLPLEFRSILQKLGRETRRRRAPGTQIGPPSPLAGRDVRSTAAEPEIHSAPDDDFAEILSITIPEIPLPGRAPRSAPASWSSLEPASDEGSQTPSIGEILASLPGEPATPRDAEREPTELPGSEISDRRSPSPLLPWLPLPSMARQTSLPEESFAGMWQSPRTWSEDRAAAAPALWIASERESRPRSVEARSREEIGDAILDSHLTEIPRVILLGVGRTSIAGWRGRGQSLTPERVEALRISSEERSLFAGVAESGVPHFGPVARCHWPGALRDLLGIDPLDCAVFPVRVLDGVAAFLYADRLGEPMRSEDFPAVARAAASASNVLARFLFQRSGTAPVA
ncbi:MAG: hypothetical protein ACRD1P_13860 [Thermoanaerobaculia bacterium]